MSTAMTAECLAGPTRTLSFAGKGGTEKTSTARASAGTLAAAGRRVLLVSTDPASTRGEDPQTDIGRAPTPVTGRPRLDAIEIDPETAAAA